nr:SoxR reducing system RseC family protein [Fusobacterium sp.]
LIVYILPPVFMILGYVVAASLNFSEGLSALGSFIGLGLAFLLLFLYDRFFAKKNIEEEIKIIAVEKYDPNNLEYDISCDENFEHY